MKTIAGGDRVRLLRAPGLPRDSLSLRRTLERAIGPASLQSRSSGMRSIVCVRRLGMSDRGIGGAAWTARLESRMQQVIARAVRPLVDVVPADADAVIFRDDAELLACLARDWRGGAGGAWWWRGLFGSALDDYLVQRTLAGAPTLLPAVLTLLAERGDAVRLLEALPPRSCEELSAAVRAAFGLSGTAARLHAAQMVDAESRAGPLARIPTTSIRTFARVLAGAADATTLIALAPARRHLLLLALMLMRAPALARVAPLEHLLARWLQRHTDATMREAVASPRRPHTRDARRTAASRRAPALDDVTVMSAHTTLRAATPSPGSARPESEPFTRSSPREAGSALASPVPVAGKLAVSAAPSGTAAPDMPGHDSAALLPSDFAGVLYLVNVALHLELYADFAHPSRPNLPLPLGDFLAIVGEEICGPAMRSDSLWRILAAVAGRDARQHPRAGATAPGMDVRGLQQGARARRRRALRFADWLSATMLVMESRSARALGVDHGEALRYLCDRPGRIALGTTHLDVHFSLAEHPLPIRMAGLDRDCGWVPAAGRIIEFHYD